MWTNLFFGAWAGAAETLSALTENEINMVEAILENDYGIDKCELNDLWFETNTIVKWLGYSDWEELLKSRE